LLIVAVLSFSADVIAPYDPMTTSTHSLQAPSFVHPLGTDNLGRDVLSRLLYGGQNTLLTAAIASLIALIPGVSLGLLTGLAPRWVDDILQIGINTLLAFPGFVLALIIITLTGRGTESIALAVGVSQVALVAQVTRGVVKVVATQDYIISAQAIGASWAHIVRVHVLRGSAPALMAYSGVVFSYSILNATALYFLGLGPLGVPDWGVMLAEGRIHVEYAPWIAFYPGLAITLTVFVVNRLAQR